MCSLLPACAGTTVVWGNGLTSLPAACFVTTVCTMVTSLLHTYAVMAAQQ
jgi:hypothetical protein